MKASDYEKAFESKPGRTAFRVGAMVILGFFGLSVIGWGLGIIAMPFRSATGVIQRTIAPDNIIQNYEWFKQQNQDVQAMDTRLAASIEALKSFEQSAGLRASWTFEDKQEWSRLNSIILGLRGQRAAMVAEYNARSAMQNRSLFKTSELPETLN